MLKKIMQIPEKVADKLQYIHFLGPLGLRLYLVPVFWVAGTEKLAHMQATIEWFGNTHWGLGLPHPELLAYLAALTEVIGAVCLLIGFATRWVTLPLMVVMVVAMMAVHIEHGWLAIASNDAPSSIRLGNFMAWLQETYPGRHRYITELGQPVILNNGVEFAVTYLLMLLSIFLTGAGKFLSVDYWLLAWCRRIRVC